MARVVVPPASAPETEVCATCGFVRRNWRHIATSNSSCHAFLLAPSLPCPEPGNCAASGECGEDAAPETANGDGGTFSGTGTLDTSGFAVKRLHNPAPPLDGEMTRRKFEHVLDCATGHLVCDYTTPEQMNQIKEWETELLAHDAALRASLAEREKEIERLKAAPPITTISYGCQGCADSRAGSAMAHHRADAAIAECDALRQRLHDSRSLQEGTATLLGDAIAANNALARIVEEAPHAIKCSYSYCGQEPCDCFKSEARALKAKARTKEQK